MTSKTRRIIILLTVVFLLGFSPLWITSINVNPCYSVGEKLDSLNGVYVYYNGGVNNVSGRNKAPDGYNLGLKYQCVEFVKRYYYEHLHHKMPDSYGHAVDFFDASLNDGERNAKRNLAQFTNPSISVPHKDDLLVYSGTVLTSSVM